MSRHCRSARKAGTRLIRALWISKGLSDAFPDKISRRRCPTAEVSEGWCARAGASHGIGR